MPTYDKNIRFLKQAIFAKLNNDSDLKALLGGAGRIFHRQPPSKAKYPCITYSVMSDRDRPFNEDQATGEFTEAFFRVTIFSRKSTTTETDNIEARVKQLLNGQNTLDTTKIICYSCFRDNLVEPIQDPDLLIWVTPVRYRTQWATK